MSAPSPHTASAASARPAAPDSGAGASGVARGANGGRSLTITPISQADAFAFVTAHHRHHDAPIGHKFSIAVADEAGVIRGVAIVGRPVARKLDDGWTVEVIRVATDGCENACSALYGAARRTAFALGYRRIITYTLAEESGASLRGAGFVREADTPGRSWSCPSRPREDHHPLGAKVRWGCSIAAAPWASPPKVANAVDDGQPALFGRTA